MNKRKYRFFVICCLVLEFVGDNDIRLQISGQKDT